MPDEKDVHDQAEEVHPGAGEKDGSPSAEGHVVLCKNYRLVKNYLHGDTSGCSIPPVDIDMKVAF